MLRDGDDGTVYVVPESLSSSSKPLLEHVFIKVSDDVKSFIRDNYYPFNNLVIFDEVSDKDDKICAIVRCDTDDISDLIDFMCRMNHSLISSIAVDVSKGIYFVNIPVNKDRFDEVILHKYAYAFPERRALFRWEYAVD